MIPAPDPGRVLDSFIIVLHGKPVPGTRAQSKYRWIPKRQAAALDQIKLAASEIMRDRPMLTGPLILKLTAEMPIPKSFSIRKRADAISGKVWPIVTPDLKNIVWLAEDAMKSVVYADDALICEHRTRKIYSTQPKIVIVVSPLN